MHQNTVQPQHRYAIVDNAHVAISLTLIQLHQLLLGLSKLLFRKLRRFRNIPFPITPFNVLNSAPQFGIRERGITRKHKIMNLYFRTFFDVEVKVFITKHWIAFFGFGLRTLNSNLYIIKSLIEIIGLDFLYGAIDQIGCNVHTLAQIGLFF